MAAASNGFSAGEAVCITRLVAGLRRGGGAADTIRSFSEMRFLGILSFGTLGVDCFSIILTYPTEGLYSNFLSIPLQLWRRQRSVYARVLREQVLRAHQALRHVDAVGASHFAGGAIAAAHGAGFFRQRQEVFPAKRELPVEIGVG